MAARQSDESEFSRDSVVVRRRSWQRVTAIVLLGLMILLALLVAGLWIAACSLALALLRTVFDVLEVMGR